jgi:hypothetical protein
MNIAKSTRHSHITGLFAETLVLYWLSRDGFECSRIDHTGIDLLAEQGKNTVHWGMTHKYLERYRNDPEIKCAELSVSVSRWWDEPRCKRD